MLLTLGLTGMDQATEAALKTSFSDANERLGLWVLQAEADADYVIVDMDSMYGPMSWLRLHAAGKRVVGLTSAPRTQADYRLARPFSASTLSELLLRIAQDQGADTMSTAAPEPHTATASSVAPPAQAFVAAQPPRAAATMASPQWATEQSPASGPASFAPVGVSPAPASPMPEAAPSAPPPPMAPASSPRTPSTYAAVAPAPTATASVPTTAVAPTTAAKATASETEETPPTRGANFVEWLRPGALTGRARYQSGKGPSVLIDFVQRHYYGPATLKPLAEYFLASVGLRDFEQLDEASWQRALAAVGGEPQPLARLQWFGALLAGEGRLLPGFSVDGKFQLNKWPQTEREYPRHFRIATAMMKGPMTIAEIATASGVPATDVIDFINASLTTGFAEPAGGDATKGSLLGMLRGR